MLLTASHRELARGATDGVLLETRRWTMDPSFHLQSATADTGDPVPDEILDGVERVLVNPVPELTGGLYRVKVVARGLEVSGPEEGWVRVSFYRNSIDGSSNQGYASGWKRRLHQDPLRSRPRSEGRQHSRL
jgi:hypothetical protein